MRARSWQQTLPAHSLDPLINLLPCSGVTGATAIGDFCY